MNERIRELAKQAGLEMCGCGCDMPTRQTNKFAELVVKECCKVMNEHGSFYGEVMMSPLIMKHFGVE